MGYLPDAAAVRSDLDRVLKVRSGAEHAIACAVALDPGFALGHVGLALLCHECAAAVDAPSPTLSVSPASGPTNASGPSWRW
ncbi:hypothetical protein ABZX77_18890 [Streptomyces sp. NPDC004237]|uniref:hypothetical protein n=1 Tax=Streptomyces sp. NPDC004237 TaxID=3154455 RepID=UPI0033AF1908